MKIQISDFIADSTLVSRVAITGIDLDKHVAQEGYDALL
jgi:hypothetical protein